MKVGILVAVLVIGYFVYTYVVFQQQVTFAKKFSATVHPYEKESSDHSKTLLILGDSTGTGIGATNPEDSVAGLLAAHIGATYVENGAKSGSEVSSLQDQIAKIKLPHYDIILIQVGGNDVVRFHDSKEVSLLLGSFLTVLNDRADTIYVMSAGDMGTVTLFPWYVRPYFSYATLALHGAFTAICTQYGAHYINLYEPPATNPFVLDPEHYLAPDHFHPSSLGYRAWFEKFLKVENGPQRGHER